MRWRHAVMQEKNLDKSAISHYISPPRGNLDMAADDPFAGPAPAEVLLRSAPLDRVIAQVRFQAILALNTADGVAGFQEKIRSTYPAFRRELVPDITISPSGEPHATPQNVWRFSDARENWVVGVGIGFVALETRAYQSRSHFLERLNFVFHTAQETLEPILVDRIGLRYVNRLTGRSFERRRELLRSEMLGIAVGSMAERIQLNLTEINLKLPGQAGDRMLLRYGLLPLRTTYDPGNVPPLDVLSWVLDFDTYRESRAEFNATEMSDVGASLSDKAYRMFRWVVRDEFLTEHGGEL
jgi:uncharacterized protein (TIGR04255 family)